MVDRIELEKVYKQNLENDIVKRIAEYQNIDIRKALDVYYSSKLATQIERGENGVENLDPKYLAEDLIQNEPELFL